MSEHQRQPESLFPDERVRERALADGAMGDLPSKPSEDLDLSEIHADMDRSDGNNPWGYANARAELDGAIETAKPKSNPIVTAPESTQELPQGFDEAVAETAFDARQTTDSTPPDEHE